ncbi:MAG: threonine/serine exporter family protein [Oscillospiraceae bacterium]|nr:threonine/serine exporter family protein [Oscillospiraceae bacterium]
MELTHYDQYVLLDCMLEMGELLLDCGAEITRVEDTLSRMGKAYGANRVDVFVIPSLVSITLNFPETTPVTETKRITSTGSTDFYRMEKLNALSRECSREPLPLDELRARLDHVAAGHKPFAVVFWGSVLGGGGFAVFFGGSLWDGLAGAVFGAGICLLQYALGRTQLNVVASNLIVSLLAGLAIGITANLIPGLQMDKIMIGDIMLMIPGLAMTNALRNMLVGNTISGTMRLAESLIWAAALAGGFMVALAVVDRIFGGGLPV